jgi:hypothetical protein
MKKRTYYHLVLDKSGSMDSCWTEAKQVIDNQLKELARVQSENPESQILFSICAFNQELRFSSEIIDIQHAQIDWATIYPDGLTALYDAIGNSIGFIKEKAGKDLESIDADVVMLILTDGHENASHNYSGQSIKEMIRSYEQSEKWNFLFLGAGLNISDVTQELDRGTKNSFSFAKANFKKTFALVNHELEDFVKSKSQEQKKRDFFEKRNKQ